MAARKLAQEVDKCFKKVSEGVAEFEAIYEKIEQSSNPAQKDKLEDNLKREIKKLQRLRDQIKTWAASNDIKDKAPLLENRKLIETQMEKFKAVEKAMKTKAYSKEGLSAAAKLDPKEQAKVEASEFLSSMVDELEQQIETLEAEGESIQATMKKGKNNTAKAERIAEIERIIERHKWHQGKLELIRRSLENGGVEPEQVTDLEESIRYYVSDGMNEDFMEDEEMYEELDLEDEEGTYGMGADNEKNSSLDAQSVQEDITTDTDLPKTLTRKAQKEADPVRRTSSQTKSPLPALATLHAPLPTISNSNSGTPAMKPASVPTRPAGEGLKYASAAAAAAASDKNNVGIAPLPPPPGAASSSISPLPQARSSATNSPATSSAQPASQQPESKQPTPAPAPSEPEPVPAPAPVPVPVPVTTKQSKRSKAAGKQAAVPEAAPSSKTPRTNGTANGVKQTEEEEECIYHLPASLQDLVDTYETSRKRLYPPSAPSALRMMTASQASCPDIVDADVPRSYRPDQPVPPTGSGFPREPLAIFDDPRLYSRMDPDTLFYVFYYKQGTAQQYMAAKALKDQSWRFHKQYQTWFQRHEEPKNITEDFEQGTYRFFDYESTWMNRRKADFKFVYKFLEDEV
ncbi:Not1 N-terminal domain, CCR4-Not complex component-domain-containing protein [Fusarium redolens]|uniref:General negative regulator of transcription subunit n=1 Tax=Fusarium redolens TaxID=48865 RepID=A0A9P9KJZ6_FUSRE|nr:Not1 N-terminal domain, CCR4-Not complex component-domain-containing protein [Fusarium redolens]KAH7255419.1 Not1 N-terminal domain, CCR4-Not complex component-domain-containing protein [Fusarium redolens]